MSKQLVWTPELVKRFWSRVASSAMDQCAFARVAGRQFLDLVGPHLPEDAKSVVDFGAGAGHFSKLLADRGYDVGVFEPSRSALDPALLARDNVTWIDPDAPARRFDVVFCLETIEHVLDEELDSFFARIKALLKPGGALVVSTPNDENLEQALVYCVETDTFFHPWQHVRSFTPASLVELLAAHGYAKRAVGLADFSSDVHLYEEVRVLREQVRDFLPLLIAIAAENPGAAATREIAKTLDQLWETNAAALIEGVDKALAPITYTINDLNRRLEFDVRIDGDETKGLLALADRLESHAAELKRLVSAADSQDVLASDVIKVAQLVSSSASAAILRVTVGNAVSSSRALRETLAEIREGCLGLLDRLRALKAQAVHPFLYAAERPEGAGARPAADVPVGAVSELSSAELRELIAGCYREIVRRNDSADRRLPDTSGGLDFRIGRGQTIVYVGHAPG